MANGESSLANRFPCALTQFLFQWAIVHILHQEEGAGPKVNRFNCQQLDCAETDPTTHHQL
jgi:hypothetical protein